MPDIERSKVATEVRKLCGPLTRIPAGLFRGMRGPRSITVEEHWGVPFLQKAHENNQRMARLQNKVLLPVLLIQK